MTGRSKKTRAYDKPFAERLRKLMEEKDVRQYQVADAIGKSRQIISYYKAGQNEPDLETVVEIANYFGVTTDWLLGMNTSRRVDGECRCGIREDLLNALLEMKPEERDAYCELMMVIIGSRVKISHRGDTNV